MCIQAHVCNASYTTSNIQQEWHQAYFFSVWFKSVPLIFDSKYYTNDPICLVKR